MTARWDAIPIWHLPTGTDASWRRGPTGWLEVCVTWPGRWKDRPATSAVAAWVNKVVPHNTADRDCIKASEAVQPTDISVEAPAGHASGIWLIAYTG